PHFPKDLTDRNRTSPFAFTGDKFEFRMVGSASSISDPNVVLNTIVAEELRRFADILEKADDFKSALAKLIRGVVIENGRIIFNGNNYSDEWAAEAGRRGLLNLRHTVEALPAMVDAKNVALFGRHGVFTETELQSRYEILLESYAKTIRIEALTMIGLVNKEVVPAVISYQREIAGLIKRKRAINESVGMKFDSSLENDLLTRLSGLSGDLLERLKSLEVSVAEADRVGGTLELARFCRERVFADMSALRESVDGMESIVAKKHWPLPTYAELLYSVN
ncbi:MAG: glutamine synthetase, partial [Oscillospiraceae bacterium]|nr:glutamine synthetase [Oscillospiraceae bacterium]